MEWLEVPNFGIKNFRTVKDIDTLEFRPSATTLNLKNSILSMGKEKQEQSIMINSKRIIKYVNSNNQYKKLKVLPVEKMFDTNWYKLVEKQKYTSFFKINSYTGKVDISKKVALPVDISLYSDSINLSNKSELHWSTSGGFASDIDRNTAIGKGISELIENHLKMFWWFNETPIYLLNAIDNASFKSLEYQNIVKNIRVYLLGLPNKIGSYVVMCVLETKRFPFISVGFGANFQKKDAITHAICEAVHYFRGSNWYRMLGENSAVYTNKNREILSLIKHTEKYTLFNYSKNLVDPNIITNNNTFFGKILFYSKGQITVKVFSPDLQPIVNSEYVPFFIPCLVNKHNIKKRSLYKGVPFL